MKRLRPINDFEPPWLAIVVITVDLVLLMLVGIAYLQFGAVNAVVKSNFADSSAYGLSGDFFGFANAVFSALAFAMIIVTLWMQRYELKQQREELRITQDVFRQQEHEMEEQNRSLKLQAIESTFFKMLALHGEIVVGMTVKSSSGNIMGRQVFLYLMEELSSRSKESRFGTQGEVSLASYEDWYLIRESIVGHYFRTLYNTIQFVHEKGGENRKTYARLLRAQLSSKELELLLYNGLSRWGSEKFKPLIESHALLKHLSNSPDFEAWKSKYDPSAFGEVVGAA